MVTTSPDLLTPSRFRAGRQFCDEVQEYCRTVLRRLNSSGNGSGRLHKIGVTSCYCKEGVSTISAQLAATAACDDRRVLLIDGNLVRPAVQKIFHINDGPGLSEAVLHGNDVSDCIRASGVENLFVLTSGKTADNPARVYDSTELGKVIETAGRNFDLVIFDLPAAGEDSSAVRIAGLLDGVLLVVESERVRRQVARRVTEQFEQADVRLLGAVLNKRRQHVPDWLYQTL